MTSYAARRFILATLALLLIAVGFVLGTMVAPTKAVEPLDAPAQQAPAENVPLLDMERIYADVYNRISPSVVSINVVARLPNTRYYIPGGYTQGTGSGFVLDTDGHIMTNNHVVNGATRIEVNFFDGTITRAEIVGLDPDSDLAVLKVDLPADQLHPVQFADSDALYVGQGVIAIGSPFGQRWTMTTGIISATDRTIDSLGQYQIGAVIQTDAAINPGNSGGPLLDLQGRVVGVNSQIISGSRSNSGVGFAVPSNLAQRVARQLIEQGHVAYSYLGISSRPNDVDLALIEALNLPNNTQGVVVLDVDERGPAGRAGLRDAADPITIDGITVPRRVDIITRIDDHKVTGFNSLIAYLANHTEPGQTVNLTVLRDGQEIVFPVTLGERPRLDR
ncbi:MAG: trypsin-like peptidase domain-containing protein [Chloroflexota bacterium]|nr:MAG: 2-alkenal reductase [Chloroflexota bacterium]